MTTAKDYTMICLDKVLRLTGAEYNQYSQTVCIDYCRNDETCKIDTIKLHYK